MKLSVQLITIFLVLLVVSSCFGLVVERGSDIPNKFSPSDRQKKDMSEANAKLDYANIFRNQAGTIANFGSVRIDMQGTFVSGGVKCHNIQAQINGIKGASTIAHVTVCEDVMSNKLNEQKEVQRKTRNAMLESMKSGKSYKIHN